MSQDAHRESNEPRHRLYRRTFIHDGVTWSVGERPARAFDVPRSPHLVFESESTIRRVRRFPANWPELSARELYELSWAL